MNLVCIASSFLWAIMKIKELDERVWLSHPFTWRNNRGTAQTSHGQFIRFGIPEPRTPERPDDMKGGDRIGFTEVKITPEMVGRTVAVFTNIEEKTDNDRLKPGQIRWHNFVIEHGGISKIIKSEGDKLSEITTQIK